MTMKTSKLIEQGKYFNNFLLEWQQSDNNENNECKIFVTKMVQITEIKMNNKLTIKNHKIIENRKDQNTNKVRNNKILVTIQEEEIKHKTDIKNHNVIKKEI
jgi:hypothetical protein